MVRQYALMESLSVNLHNLLNQINGRLSRPDKKFLRDGLIGLLRTGKPIVCQMAKRLPDQRTTYPSRVKRLDNHLIADSNFDRRVKIELPALWAPLVGDDTPIILDLSDLAKPLAKQRTFLFGFDTPIFLTMGSHGKCPRNRTPPESIAAVGVRP